MDKKGEIKKVFTSVEILEIPYEVQIPDYKKVEMPEYVLVKEEITYKVPKIEYENKTYERPVYHDKIYEIPIYREKIYEIPKYVEKVYEVPKIKEVIKEIDIPTPVYREELKIVEKPIEVKVPNLIKEDIKVTNAIIEDKHVSNAIISHINIDAIHPKYLCNKCKSTYVEA